ncbi:MAG: DNA sulfur modification protein DndD [Candidatus Delongbacteria bacterium]|nr:DNA sulfur modification protein DndD [Candidatus Delongbacteria bacterium]
MKINHLSLHNFGIYRETVTYNFNTDDHNNIILINGKNGSGKTTLLNAFKIALYGPYYLGYKTKVQEYTEYIKKRINAYSLQDGDNKAYLTIDFSLVENGFKRNYQINRNWKLIADQLDEQVHVTRDRKALSKKEGSEFIDDLAEMLSPDYIDLFFFDGEKIDHLLAKSKSQEYIMQMFSKLFSLDLFESLHTDLNTYVRQSKINEQLDEDEKKYEQLLQKKQLLISEIKKLEQQKKDATNSISEITETLSFERKKFKEHGGLQSDDKQKIISEIDQAQVERAILKTQHKTLLNEDFPFLLLRDELDALRNELEIEKEYNETTTMLQKLDNPLFKTNLKTQINLSFEQLIEVIHNSFDIKNEVERIHDLSKTNEQLLLDTINEIEKQNIEDVYLFYEKDQTLHKKIQTSTQILHESIDQSLDEFSKTISKLEVRLAQLNESIQRASKSSEEYEQNLILLEDEVNKQYAKLKDAKKSDNTFLLIKSINSVVKQYADDTRKEKLAELQQTITDIFKTLIRKEDFINDIRIDLETEQFEILNKTGSIVPEENLSAGERQIYILSILWGLLKISNRKIPIVFDTLLGRLDKTHKHNIIHHFLHDLGQQIIILATDTEIDDEYVQMLSPFISQHYQIAYDNKTESVQLEKSWRL